MRILSGVYALHPEDLVIRFLKEKPQNIETGARARGTGQSAGTTAPHLMKYPDERSVRSSNLIDVESPRKNAVRAAASFFLF